MNAAFAATRLAGRRILLLWIASAAGLASCGAPPPPPWRPVWDAPYASFTDAGRTAMTEARRSMEAARWEEAWAVLAPAFEANEDNIELGVWLQEAELALVAAGTAADAELARIATQPDARDRLRRRYARRADEASSVARLVLAARLETDAIAAENLLDRALELDPGCAWAHYGRAHALLQQTVKRGRWPLAQESLDEALARQPSLIPARRLQAWMRAQEGAMGAAAAELEIWLERTRGDPRVSGAQRVDAELDLAMIWILEGRSRQARELLRALEGRTTARDRRLALLAAAEQATGDLIRALDAARRAEGADRDGVLPLVQQAILYEYWLDDPEEAERHWRRVARAAEGQDDLSALLQSLRARVQLERRAAAGPTTPTTR